MILSDRERERLRTAAWMDLMADSSAATEKAMRDIRRARHPMSQMLGDWGLCQQVQGRLDRAIEEIQAFNSGEGNVALKRLEDGGIRVTAEVGLRSASETVSREVIESDGLVEALDGALRHITEGMRDIEA